VARRFQRCDKSFVFIRGFSRWVRISTFSAACSGIPQVAQNPSRLQALAHGFMRKLFSESVISPLF
jgi:hypothetical protein